MGARIARALMDLKFPSALAAFCRLERGILSTLSQRELGGSRKRGFQRIGDAFLEVRGARGELLLGFFSLPRYR
jgi:hypothetical protein